MWLGEMYLHLPISNSTWHYFIFGNVSFIFFNSIFNVSSPEVING